VPDDLVWAANDTFPALGQHSFHACHHLYAGGRGRSITPMSPCPRRLPHQTNESAPPQSRPRLLSAGRFDASLSVRFATARVVARPPGPIRPEETSLSGRRGLYTRAFPQEDHPPHESGVATRHPGWTPRPDFHRLEHCRYRLHSLSAPCTTRSRIAGIPRTRTLPPSLGISTRRFRNGQ
jgi:hypothetical protein